MIAGSTPMAAEARMRAIGVAPISRAWPALASRTPLAPSESGLELPAVMFSVPGCAGSAASRSSVVSSRMDSSCSNVPRLALARGRRLDREDLLREAAAVPSHSGVAVRAQRERVDLLAG